MPARAAARSWAMTLATQASMRRLLSLRSLASRAPRLSSRKTALPMWRASLESPRVGHLLVDDSFVEPGSGRRHPAGRLRVLDHRQPLAVEELERARPPERVGGDLQHPPAPARGPDRGLDVDDGDLAAVSLSQLDQVDVGPLVDGGDDQDRAIPIERAVE
jgi:hypothetical protein